MARFAVVFRSLRLGFEVKPLPRARAEYSLLIVICGRSVVNEERMHLACYAWDPAKHFVRQDAERRALEAFATLHEAFAKQRVFSG
jgi:hypothetical protein